MLSHFPPTILRFSFAPPPSKSYNLIIRIVTINKIHQPKGSDFNMSKETFLKYGFVVLFIGIFLLRAQKVISEPLSYLFSGILLLIVAYLILVKKMNFFSSLLTVTDQPSSTQQRLGQLSGLVSLLIGLLLVILSFIFFLQLWFPLDSPFTLGYDYLSKYNGVLWTVEQRRSKRLAFVHSFWGLFIFRK